MSAAAAAHGLLWPACKTVAQWLIKGFGGEIPRKDPRELPEQMAEQAWNCDLSAGPLDGLPIPVLTKDLTSKPGAVRRAYRLPGPNPGDPDAWLALPSEFSSVVRSPLANDTLHRIYWTNPAGVRPGGWWNTYAGLIAGTADYNLGFTAPNPATVITVAAAGGTLTIPLVARAYLFTYVDLHGEESSPCVPSVVVEGASDGTWTISGLPTTAPASPAGFNFPAVAKLRLYRTIVGATTAAGYYQVVDIALPMSGTYVDTIPDTTVVQNVTLLSTSFSSPPVDLDGLVGFPGGMMMGFTGNTVHFCEPERPNAWPAGYDQSLQYQIMGFGVWQNSLVVLTKGFPSTGVGVNPANFAFTQVQVPEPCISRGSIITDLMGVYYASQNGLVMLNYFGMQNQTLSNFTKTDWLKDFKAANLVACRHRAQYLAINGTGTGFIIDYTEPRMGVVHLNTFSNAVCVWNDVYTGETYIIADKKVYLWDSPTAGSLNYRWRSKQFYLPQPVSLGACQISLETAVESPPGAAATPLLDNGDPSLVLPEGVNAVFNLYAGPEGKHLILSKILNKSRMIFRLPSGRKAFLWQCEIVGRVAVHSIELATTMKELRNV